MDPTIGTKSIKWSCAKCSLLCIKREVQPTMH